MPATIAFSKIDAETFQRHFQNALTKYQKGIRSLQKKLKHPTFHDVMVPLERLKYEFDAVWNPLRHLLDVKKTSELDKAYQTAKQQHTELISALYQNHSIYEAILKLKQDKKFQTRSEEQQSLILKYIRDFELQGVHLSEENRQQLAEINQRIAALQTIYMNHKTDSLNVWEHHIEDIQELAGIPEHTIQLAAQNAQKRGKNGWVLTLAPNMVTDILKFCQNRHLRQLVKNANDQTASYLAQQGQYDNGPIISLIIGLKQQKAKLLGYSDYLDLALVGKMAERADVTALLEDLTTQLKPQAQQEYELLVSFAKARDQIDTLEPHDVAYYAEQVKSAYFQQNGKLIQSYFPYDRVLLGMFATAQKLFGLDFKEEEKFDAWNNDVMLYSVYDKTGAKLGEIYMDLYARNGEKRAGAWMEVCAPRYIGKHHQHLPIAFLNTNFGKGVDSKPALLSHREVQTLFHEFGHCLHLMLADSKFPSLAGPDGVPWDAVEAPSQMMENWIWEKEALKLFSGHVESGDPLPDETIDSLRNTRYYNAALETLMHLAHVRFDHLLHCATEPLGPQEIQALWLKIRNETQVYPTTQHDFLPNTLHHIFSGSYDGLLYTYKWSLNLAQNLFSAFQTNGIFDTETAQRYQQTILAPGGIKPFKKQVEEFLGQPIKTDMLCQTIAAQSPLKQIIQPHQTPSPKTTHVPKANPPAPANNLRWAALIGTTSSLIRLLLLQAQLWGSIITGGITFMAAYLVMKIREGIKIKSLQLYDSELRSNSNIDPSTAKAFTAGAEAALSYKAQVASCFMWEAYRYPVAYYAGMRKMETGTMLAQESTEQRKSVRP